MNLDFGRLDHPSRCEAAALVFSYVLRERFEAKRAESRVVGLGEVDADKSMRLFDKLWRAHLAARSAPVEYCFPVEKDFHAKHGDRLAFVRQGPGREFEPVLTYIRDNDRLTDPAYRKLRWIATEQKNWGEIFLIEPQTDLMRVSALGRRGILAESDIRPLQNLAEAVAVPTERQVIALGRHETAPGTARQLTWELIEWANRATDAVRHMKGHLAGSISGDKAWEAIWQLWSYARECRLKSGIDPESAWTSDFVAYHEGRRLIEERAADLGQASDLLLKTHPSADAIWGDNRVRVLEFPSACAWGFSRYLAGVLAGLPDLGPSLYKHRLSSVGVNETNAGHKDTLGCLSFAEEERPATCSAVTLAKRALLMPHDALMPPSDAWSKRKGLSEFIDGAEHALEQLLRHHVRPVIAGSRMQIP